MTMRLIIIVLIASLVSSTAFAQEAADWYKVAETIPLGSKVRVQLLNGDRVTGTLMRVDGAAVLVKKDTRRPEMAVAIPYDDIGKIERRKEGGVGSIAKVIAVGAAAGAGAMVTLILFALQLD
jgi:small nuclear ribonucleoprotein (snRNP)-like protein